MGQAWRSPPEGWEKAKEERGGVVLASPGHEPGRGIIHLRGSYLTTPVTVQNASAEKTRVWVACALAATRKQLADEKLEYPGHFKEALLEEYRERAVYEKPPSMIVVELEHPHWLSDIASVTQEVSTFEFEKAESGTLFYGKEPARPRRQGSALVPVPRSPREIRHAKFCRYAAWVRALAWWCEQLEWRLQPPEVGGLLKEKGEPSGLPAKTKQAVEVETGTLAKWETKKQQPNVFEGLHESQKAHGYSDMLASAGLTKMQYDCASLAFEFGLNIKEIASRVGRHRKTVRGHLDAAGKKIGMTRLKERGAKKIAKTKPGSLD